MKKIQKIGIILILVIACVCILHKVKQKSTYIEFEKIGEYCNEILDMSSNEFVIEQEFSMPYEIFHGFSFRIGTYSRENNSIYEMVVIDKTTNKVITQKEFNTTSAKDDRPYYVLLKSPIKVDNTHEFSVVLKAKTPVNAENAIAFYAEKNIESTASKLYYNGLVRDANLCMDIYGGEQDNFYFIFTLVCEVYIVSLVIYMMYLYSNKKSIKDNLIIQASVLGIIVFAMLAVLSRMVTFSDEVDNIIGGMLIEKGRVIYADYYTQHTPFAYLLCSVFAMFQAGSVEHFRLMFYILIALAYVGLYLRHRDNFGKVKMALFPIIQIMFGVFVAKETVMVLSDNIQSICMISLVLEFLQYLKDEKLDWKRSIIVSISIFCGFTSAFVTIYMIFAICLGVFIKEILYWINNKSISFKNIVIRYWKLVISCMIPFGLLLIYFIATKSLTEFYEQSFKFNTEVYSYYMPNGFGANVIQPFFFGITNFIQIIPNAVQKILNSQEIIISIVNIILTTTFMIVLIDMIRKKEYIKPVILALFVSFGLSRTNETFHIIAAWASLLTVILICFDWQKYKKNSITKIILGILILFIAGSYMENCTIYFFKKPEAITSLDQKVISETSEGEEIFYDIYSNSSVYLIYKNRLPINRLGFILPWYMDWYEVDTITDLSSKKPRLVIYDEELKAWGISGYDDYLKKYLHENYEQTPEISKLWIIK